MSDHAKILLIERGGSRSPSFVPALRKRSYRVKVEHDIRSAIEHFHPDPPDIVILDAASMKTSGVRMASRLHKALNGIPLVLVSPKGTNFSSNGRVSEFLVRPFTARKLLNLIARLSPADSQDEICAGPIRLDTSRRVVRYRNRETRLTPKAAALLRLLIERLGRLVKREEMMRRVWHTDYTGDMRTIDVHISWLRKAIEPDPDSPRYLKTIRGLGYRLDLPDDKPSTV
jgi:DNA-binding response OmpR family regulator